MRAVPVLIAALAGIAMVAPTEPAAGTRERVDVHVNQIQVLGTHNSYHQRPNRRITPGEPADYTHPPLAVQLDEEGVRSFEIDAFNGPGFPVLHTPLIDNVSTCPMLADCLTALAAWHDAHPHHVPIFVLIEPKTQSVVLDQSLVPWDAAALDRLDAAIRSVFRGKSLLTPDDVRGRSHTLRDAVTTRGWPTLRRANGRVAFVLSTAGPLRTAYLAGRSSLQGRPMFVTADPQAPSAAVVKRDTPVERDIRRLVRRGFVVRTLADDKGIEARAGDHARADLAIRSGAQIVSTDYPVADPTVGPYTVRVAPDDLPARCNPVNAPHDCRDRELERLGGG